VKTRKYWKAYLHLNRR